MYCFSLWLDHCSLFHRLLSPLSAVPLISLAGFGLYELGFPGVRVSLEILFFFFGCSLPHKTDFSATTVCAGCKVRGNWAPRNHSTACIFSGDCSSHNAYSHKYSCGCWKSWANCICPLVQYLPHVIHVAKPVFDRFAVIFTIAIVWLYAYILTASGAYKNARPKTQVHCRVDRSGIISGAPW